jgi:excisionase family DNA binding protein
MAEYLTVKDAAKLMLVSQRTVLRWVELGRLRPVRIGHTLRFEKSRLLLQLEKYEYGDGRKHDPALG